MDDDPSASAKRRTKTCPSVDMHVEEEKKLEARVKGGSRCAIGHLHDDIILLLLPESFRVLLSCAN